MALNVSSKSNVINLFGINESLNLEGVLQIILYEGRARHIYSQHGPYSKVPNKSRFLPAILGSSNITVNIGGLINVAAMREGAVERNLGGRVGRIYWVTDYPYPVGVSPSGSPLYNTTLVLGAAGSGAYSVISFYPGYPWPESIPLGGGAMIEFVIKDVECAFEVDGSAYLPFHTSAEVSLSVDENIYTFEDAADLIVGITAISSGKLLEYGGYLDSSYFNANLINQSIRLSFQGAAYFIDVDQHLIDGLRSYWLLFDQELARVCDKSILWDRDFPLFNENYNILIDG